MPKTTTWNSRRLCPARSSLSSSVQLGPGRLVLDLPDHAFGVLGLHGRGLDHVVGGLDRWTSSRAAIARANRPAQSAPRPPGATIKTIRKATPRPRECWANRSCKLGQRAEQPGRQAHGDDQGREHHVEVRRLAFACVVAHLVGPSPWLGAATGTFVRALGLIAKGRWPVSPAPDCDRIDVALHQLVWRQRRDRSASAAALVREQCSTRVSERREPLWSAVRH